MREKPDRSRPLPLPHRYQPELMHRRLDWWRRQDRSCRQLRSPLAPPYGLAYRPGFDLRQQCRGYGNRKRNRIGPGRD